MLDIAPNALVAFCYRVTVNLQIHFILKHYLQSSSDYCRALRERCQATLGIIAEVQLSVESSLNELGKLFISNALTTVFLAFPVVV